MQCIATLARLAGLNLFLYSTSIDAPLLSKHTVKSSVALQNIHNYVIKNVTKN